MPKLSDLLDLSLLNQHINDRVVSRRELEGSSLHILNYTAKAQYDNIWDSVTRQTRGLIYDDRTGEVVSRPLQKFFNYNDQRHPETLQINLPPYAPFVTKKYDGSLGIGYKHQGKWRVATRGSFHSEQAEWATKWLRKQEDISFPDGWTPLFEIVYAANKIVVDYDWEGLVLIGMVHNETGREIAPRGLRFIAEGNGLRPVEYFDRPVSGLLEENAANEEGYVLAYHVDDGAPLRVKIKFSCYCDLHRLLHHTSPVTIWETLKDGSTVNDFVANVSSSPAPFQHWVRSEAMRIGYAFANLNLTAEMRYRAAPPYVTRKEYALWAKEQGELTPLLFACLDGRDITDMVWKMVRPANAQPFKQEEA